MFKKSPHVRSSFDSPYIRHTYAVGPKVSPHERSAIVTRSNDEKRQCDKSICRVRVVYDAMPRRTYDVLFLTIAYQLRLNDVSRSMHCVRAAYGRRSLRWIDVTSTIVRHYMINHYINATIASKITLSHSFKSHGRGRNCENSCWGFGVDFVPEWKTKKADIKIEAREKH